MGYQYTVSPVVPDGHLLVEPLWVLNLVDLRWPGSDPVPVARGRSVDELVELMTSECVDPYEDGGVRKRFRRGGPLEWYEHPGLSLNGCFTDYVEIIRQAVLRVQTIPSVASMFEACERAVLEVLES